MNKAIFLDKDGTLIPDIPYNVHPGLIVLSDGAAEALRDLQNTGYLLIVVSNQAGVARGLFPENALREVETRITGLLRDCGIRLNGFYYCPHHPDGLIKAYAIDCACRKPKPGMILQAAKDLNVDLEQSWMIGDILHDVEAGSRAGCRTILINNGNETEWVRNEYRFPTVTASNLLEAAELILQPTLENNRR